MIDPNEYLQTLNLPMQTRGGQELILGEVCGLLASFKRVWVPFDSCITLREKLRELGHIVLTSSFDLKPFDAAYFGTPTIVDDHALFGEEGTSWTKEGERRTMRHLVEVCEAIRCKRIVTGLGSGDVSIAERIEDMGEGAQMVAYKKFDEFEDWVLVRDVKA